MPKLPLPPRSRSWTAHARGARRHRVHALHLAITLNDRSLPDPPHCCIPRCPRRLKAPHSRLPHSRSLTPTCLTSRLPTAPKPANDVAKAIRCSVARKECKRSAVWVMQGKQNTPGRGGLGCSGRDESDRVQGCWAALDTCWRARFLCASIITPTSVKREHGELVADLVQQKPQMRTDSSKSERLTRRQGARG